MRRLADRDLIHRFMRRFGRDTSEDAQVYFTGGATAVLFGWRDSTVDVDVRIVPDRDSVLRVIPGMKEDLQINVELASPMDFIPVRDGWEARSPYIGREGRLSFHHFDLYAQALAKIERAHAQDLDDVREMLRRELIDPAKCLEYFGAIEPLLYRYPAVDARRFRARVEHVLGRL
jgi:hypothetical protein